MDSKFRVPVTLMLTGLALCVAALVWLSVTGVPDVWPVWIAPLLFAAAGGLIVLSGAT